MANKPNAEEIIAERIKFSAHENIIYDLVHSQNGTVATALRELVMNAIDHGSEKCEIKLSKKGFSVLDWGTGFESEKTIKTYFKNFGEPHKEGDAKFGRFRIGRGQIMAFGRITWKSNTYSMTVDTQKNGLSFDFIDHKSVQWSGCRVDGIFYTELSSDAVYRIKDELRDFLCYVGVKITFNGEALNSDIENEKWDVDDGDILIQWKGTDGIKIYSQGVFVKQINSWRYGFEARVVTRKALKLNMARNEVTDGDPLWVRISEYFSKKSLEIAKRKGKGGRISTIARRSMIRQFFSGELPSDEVVDFCIFKDCRGHSVSIRNIADSGLKFTVSPSPGSRKAEVIATRRMAQVLDHDVLSEFKVVGLEELLSKVATALDEIYYDHTDASRCARRLFNKPIIGFEDIAATLIDDSILYPRSKYTAREAAARNAIQHGSNLMARELSKILERDIKARNVILAISDAIDGCTNGIDTISISKHMLPLLDQLARSGGIQIALLLLHEYLHNEDDAGSHQHDIEFMSQYHDIAGNYEYNVIGRVSEGMYSRYLAELSNKNLELPKKIKNEFTYPVINNVHRYVLSMKTATITPLLKTILDWLELPRTIEKRKVIISIGNNSNLINFDEYFYRKIKRLGSNVKPLDYYSSIYSDLSIAIKEFKSAVARELEVLLGFSGVGSGFYVDLVNALHIKELLNVLCSTEQSGVLFVTHDHYGAIRNVFNNEVHYTHSINFPFQERRWGSDRCLQTHSLHEEFAASKPGRLRYAKQIIEHAFMGITDESERMELANMLLSHAGKECVASVAELFVSVEDN